MTSGHRVFVVLVHGIGPQNAPAQYAFLDNLKTATAEHLARRGQQGLITQLCTLRADWSHLFAQYQQAWLHTLFPDHATPAIRRRRLLKVLGYGLSVPILVALGAGYGVLKLPVAPGWILGTLAGLVAAAVIGRFLILPYFPWGNLWTMGRSFEANTVSDVILYESDGPRQQILDVVATQLAPHFSEAYPCLEGDERTYLPVVFVGHSLGTVVVYDLLLGISARARGITTAVDRELAVVERNLTARMEPDKNSSRMAFLKQMQSIHDIVYPVGMITLGSPIALFLFRKPTVAARNDLWREACPIGFRTSGTVKTRTGSALRWRWQNFWHASDFVAHRLAPLFNVGYPGVPGQFVEDERTYARAGGPISAHSTYWTERAVLDRIGEHVSEILSALA